jgi:serine/threonine protein phosphatase 1
MSHWVQRLVGTRHKPPRVPDGACVYAVGDIHGRSDLLEPLLERIWADAPQAANTLVFLGDYIDRGPSSKQVIDRVAQLERPGWDIIKLRGNHEQIMLEYLQNADVYQAWRTFGGAETLLSYGVKPPVFSDAGEIRRAHAEFLAALPRSHLGFLNGLETSYIVGDYFFVHAGVRPGLALERQMPEDMLWIRDEFLSSDIRFGKVVVHGHSPSEKPIIRPNRIGIDTGAYATGALTAVKFVADRCTFLCSNDK